MEHALGFAKVMGGAITLLHVDVLDESLRVLRDYSRQTDQQHVTDRLREHTSEKLEALQQHAGFPSDVSVSTKTVSGDATRKILDEITAGGFDLVILSARERSGLSGVFGFSVLEGLIRNSPCPVLVLKAAEEDTPLEDLRFEFSSDFDLMARVSRILFPTDLSDHSLRGLETAVAIAEKFQASIDIVHVLEEITSFPLVSWELFPGVEPEEFYRHAEEKSRNRLRAAIERVAPSMNWVNYEILRGQPHESIIRSSRETPYDAIVLSTHGRRGFPRLILGSVGEKVIRRAGCPVLAVPGN